MLSLVIPTYTLTDRQEELAIRCIKSFKEQADEIIVTEDGGRFSEQLRELADVYIYNKQNKGFTANVNRGWKQVKGDFVAIINSDTHLVTGNIKDLCIPSRLTSPKVLNQKFHKLQLRGCFFVVPKDIQEKYGYLDESMVMYYSDQAYADKTIGVFVEVPNVVIFHHCAETVANIDQSQYQKEDQEAYEK